MLDNRIDFDLVREIALALPGVEESTLHGVPSLKVSGRLLTCPALYRSAESNSLVVRIGFEQRAELVGAKPDAYYVTDHYLNHPAVLVRLGQIDQRSLKDLLALAWRFVTAKNKGSRRGRRRHASAVPNLTQSRHDGRWAAPRGTHRRQ
jgi:hypothetical protein